MHIIVAVAAAAANRQQVTTNAYANVKRTDIQMRCNHRHRHQQTLTDSSSDGLRGVASTSVYVDK